MKKQGVLASVVVCLLPLSFFMGTQTATAKQCNVAMPSKPKAHWSYRLIDGRKCWYEGQNNLSKSLLTWSVKASPRDKSWPRLEKEEALPVKEAMTTITQRPSSAPDQDACCGTESETPYTFEARWRDLLSHD
jgi:hypothetical protein